MSFKRKFLIRFLNFLLAISLLSLAGTTVLRQTVGNPNSIKNWLNKSGNYDKIVDTVVDNIPKDPAQTQNSIPLGQPELRSITNKVFSPKLIQGAAENFVDGTYHWIQGKSVLPDFRVDLTPVVDNFKMSMSDYLRTRLSSLTPCAKNQTPKSSNPFEIDCLPRGYSVDALVAQFRQSLNQDPQLSKTLITVDNFKKPDGSSPFDHTKQVPKIYRIASFAPYIFIGLIVLLGAGIILLSTEKSYGLRLIAKSLLSAAILVLVDSLIQKYGVNFAANKIVNLNGTSSQTAQTLAVPLLKIAIQSMVVIYWWFVGIYAALAAGIYVYLLKTKPALKTNANIKS